MPSRPASASGASRLVRPHSSSASQDRCRRIIFRVNLKSHAMKRAVDSLGYPDGPAARPAAAGTAAAAAAVAPGGLEESVNEGSLHAAFIPFGDIKDVNIPLDHGTQKHRGFGFVTFLEKEDAAAAMDNMANAELFGRVLTVNYAQPIKIKGGEQGWANQPGRAITLSLSLPPHFPLGHSLLPLPQQQQEEAERQRLEAESAVRSRDAAAREAREGANNSDEEDEAPADAGTAQQPPDAMVAAEAQALGNGS
eukprot:SM000114S24148  [mRNA]  locus=s114:273018:274908:- [translate_table: standard]